MLYSVLWLGHTLKGVRCDIGLLIQLPPRHHVCAGLESQKSDRWIMKNHVFLTRLMRVAIVQRCDFYSSIAVYQHLRIELQG